MAKKKAAVKKVGSKVTPKKAGSRKQHANLTQIPLDSSAYVKFESFRSTSSQVGGITTTTVTTRATALDCSPNRYEISTFDINATLGGQPGMSLIAVDPNSINRSEADVTFQFSAIPDGGPGVRDIELVITVLTKKTRTLQV